MDGLHGERNNEIYTKSLPQIKQIKSYLQLKLVMLYNPRLVFLCCNYQYVATKCWLIRISNIIVYCVHLC